MYGLEWYLLQCALLISATSALRAVFQRRARHGVFRLLWIAVAARMLVPAPLVAPSGAPSIAAWLASSLPAASSGADVGPGLSVPAPLDAPSTAGHTGSTSELLLAVWLVGSAVCAVACALMYRAALRRAAPLGDVDDPVVLGWLEGVGLRRRVRAAWSRAGTPAVRGILRPVILLPTWFPSLGEEAKLAALEHELVHIRRFDAAVKVLILCAVCVQWFNPLAWVAASLGFRDIELACDEAVLKEASPRERASYARLLLDAVDMRQGLLPSLSGRGYASLKKRIFAAMRPTRPCLPALCAVLALFLASAAIPAMPTMTWAVVTGDYELVIPEYWSGRVSVYCDGSEVRVYPEGSPDCPLVIAKVVDGGEPLEADRPGLALLDSGTTPSGGRVELWGIDYLSMVAGDAWRTAAFANPGYPGELVEAEIVDLMTGGRCDFGTLKDPDALAMSQDQNFDVIFPELRIKS